MLCASSCRQALLSRVTFFTDCCRLMSMRGSKDARGRTKILPNHARALRRKARPQNRGSKPWSLSTTKESSKLTSLTRSQLRSDTRACAHFLSRASRLWPLVSWVILPSARFNRRQGSRIRPTTFELIQVGWRDRHSLAGRSRCLVPKLLFGRRFREPRKQQPLCRLSLTQSRRKRAQPFSTRGKCRRRRRVSRRRCKRRPSPLLLMQSHRKRAQPFSSRSKCRRRRRVSRRCCKRQPSPLLLMQSRRKRTPPFSIRNGCRRRRRVARRSSSPTWKFLRKSPCLGRGPPLPRRGGRCWCCRGLLERR
jgi:hypothetical protein